MFVTVSQEGNCQNISLGDDKEVRMGGRHKHNSPRPYKLRKQILLELKTKIHLAFAFLERDFHYFGFHVFSDNEKNLMFFGICLLLFYLISCLTSTSLFGNFMCVIGSLAMRDASLTTIRAKIKNE